MGKGKFGNVYLAREPKRGPFINRSAMLDGARRPGLGGGRRGAQLRHRQQPVDGGGPGPLCPRRAPALSESPLPEQAASSIAAASGKNTEPRILVASLFNASAQSLCQINNWL